MAVDTNNVWNETASSHNYISQINTGTSTFDIATHHSIKFYDGRGDKTGITWNGVNDLEIVIPAISDIVTDPITFGGVADGELPSSPKKGNVYFVSEGFTEDKVGAVEPGDMLIWDGNKWYAVSGEDQISISGIGAGETSKTFTLTGTATDIVTIEGKTIKLAIDYSELNDALDVKVTTNASNELYVNNGTVTVEGSYIALVKSSDSTSTIGTTVEKDFATALKSGAVTISDKVFASSDFDLTAGSFPTVQKNDSAISVSASTSIAINKTTGSDFVSAITGGAVSSVDFVDATYGSAQLNMVTSMSAVDGTKEFVIGAHVAESDEEKAGAGDLVIPGAVSITGTKTFVSGLGAEAATGDVVSSITVGTVSVSTEGTDLVRGLDTAVDGDANDVVTNVAIGSVSKSTGDWFYSGMGSEVSTGWDVLTSVSVGEVKLEVDTKGGADAFVNATVSDHVLSFGTSKFQTPVSISQASTVLGGKTFTKSGVSLTGFAVKSANLLKGSVAQADTTISYKNVLTGSFDLSSDAAVKYYFDKDVETIYSYETAGKSLDIKNAVIATSSYDLINKGITASIAANSVVVALNNDGVFPELSISAPSATISGIVGTELTVSKDSWIALNNTVLSVAGGYSLDVVAEGTEGAIAVAVPDTYDVDDATVTIAASTYVTGVTASIVTPTVAPSNNA